ncbi:MAG: GNAT family protein [Candidatus Babeliaceae bacterium]
MQRRKNILKRKNIFWIICLMSMSLQGMIVPVEEMLTLSREVTDYSDPRLLQERVEILSNLPKIKTKRLLLRKLEQNNAQALLSIASDSKLFQFGLVILQHQTLEKIRKSIQTVFEQPAEVRAPFWVIEALRDQEIVGLIYYYGGNHEVDHRAFLEYFVKPAYWNQGIATEAAQAVIDFAFNNLKLHRIEASVHPDNKASIRVLEKLGMQQEGYAKDYMFCNGKFEDRKLYALVEGTYRKNVMLFK